MQKTLIVLTLICALAVTAQQAPKRPLPPVKPKAVALPSKIYNTLRDSCTQLDIVFITGKGGSLSLEGRSVRIFTSFINTSPTEKINALPQDGTIMWQINGRAYLMGNLYFSGDSSGYVTFTKDDKEYVNALTPSGAGFLARHGK